MQQPAENNLYARWREIATCQGETIAVLDQRSGRAFSFLELAELAEAQHTAFGPVAVAAQGFDFLLQTLSAWRDKVPLVPLESGSGFDLGRLDGLPPGIAHVKQTSGTTGDARLVLFDAPQLAADAANIVATMGLDQHRWNVAVISLAHSYGFSNLVLPLLLHGVPLLIGNGPLPNAVEAALEAAGDGAILPAVPAMWQAWHSAGILDSSRVALAISAGAPLATNLEQAIFSESAIKVHNFYGSSECGGIAYDASEIPRQDGRYVGTALQGVRLNLTQSGKLRVNSAAVATGYWPEDREGALAEPYWFATADLGQIDATGGVTLIGREGETINVAGRKVAPSEIEAALSTLPGVRCCVVFGVASEDPQRVEEIVACVAGEGDERQWRSALQALLQAWQIPRRWWTCQELAPNKRGKLSRAEWRSRYLEHEAHAP